MNSLSTHFVMDTNNQQPALINIQLSYSSLDIQNSVFHGCEYTNPMNSEGDEEVAEETIMVVNGNLYILRDDAPEGVVPFTDQAQLFRLAGINQAENP